MRALRNGNPAKKGFLLTTLHFEHAVLALGAFALTACAIGSIGPDDAKRKGKQKDVYDQLNKCLGESYREIMYVAQTKLSFGPSSKVAVENGIF